MPATLDLPELYDGILWRRPFAYAADAVIVGAILTAFWIIFFVLGLVTLGLAWLLIPGGVVLSFPVIAVLYHALLVGGQRSATWGMRLFDLKVRSIDGLRPGPVQAGLQAGLFYATVPFTGFLILLVALLNPRYRLLHDFLSGTVVIRSGATRLLLVP